MISTLQIQNTLLFVWMPLNTFSRLKEENRTGENICNSLNMPRFYSVSISRRSVYPGPELKKTHNTENIHHTQPIYQTRSSQAREIKTSNMYPPSGLSQQRQHSCFYELQPSMLKIFILILRALGWNQKAQTLFSKSTQNTSSVLILSTSKSQLQAIN